MPAAQLSILELVAPAIHAGLIHCDRYREPASRARVACFHIGGGIGGDFPICVPSIKYDPNEKITWDKLTEKTRMLGIDSEATIIAPLIVRALIERPQHPAEANALFSPKGPPPSRA
jgi:deoxyhypusine synthase